MLLDSTFIHDLLRDDPDAAARLHELIDAHEPVALSSLTVFEIGVGLRGDAEQYRTQFQHVVDDLDVIESKENTRAFRRGMNPTL